MLNSWVNVCCQFPETHHFFFGLGNGSPLGYGFSTMSFFIGPSIASSSSCSFFPTLNLFKVATKSLTSALKSAIVTPIPACASFILLQVYLQGPPVASQSWFTRHCLK